MKKTVLVALLLAGAFSAAAGAASPMKPGLWEITSQHQMEGAAMPAMPNISPEQMEKMKAMGVKMPTMGSQGMSMTTQQCVTKEQAESGAPPQSKNADNCQQKSVSRSGNTLSWSVECTGPHPATGSGSVTFDSPEHYSGDATINTKDTGHGPITMKLHYSGKWLSASCDAK